jgi:hypothetical protein
LSAEFFSSVFDHQPLDPDSDSREMLDPNPDPDPQPMSQQIGNTDLSTITRELFLSSCNKAALSQQWDIEHINLDQLKKWDDPTKDLV